MVSIRRAGDKGGVTAARGLAAFAGAARLALTALTALTVATCSLGACLPRGHVELPARSDVSAEPGLGTVWGRSRPARYRGDRNRLGDTPAGADDHSRADAQLASATGMPHINDVATRVRYNGAYFEVDVEVNGDRGIVPVVWDMLRAQTPLIDDAYYAQVYTSRGWASGRQAPYLGPTVILPEAFTPELTPEIFEYFKYAYVSWNRNFNGWTQGMTDAWMKTAAINFARAWTPEYVGEVAVTAARARITGRLALGAAAVPGARASARACAGGRCPCFVAGTPVATAHGSIPIERVTVGQRVLPASPACAAVDAAAEAFTEYHLQIRGADGDVFVIRLLRPRRWPRAPGARPGDLVPVELDEINVRGLALVTAWDPHPHIDMDGRHGCMVTGTVSHVATTLSVLRLAGDHEPVIATPWHRMYSHTRGDWVAVEDLAAGELLRTADGAIAVESVAEFAGQREPVFNLEVAGSHRYFVHSRRVLTHNTYGAARGGGGGGGSSGRSAPAARPASPAGTVIKPSSRALGRALEREGHVRPPGTAAHHIVAGKKLEAAPARRVLQRFGIGINDAPNGVFLPARSGSPNSTGAAVHAKLHTRAYYEAVNRKFEGVTTRQEALDALANIRRSLQEGRFP